MKAIIFGANGQDGFYLAQLLKKEGLDVIGVSRHGDFIHADISDLIAVRNIIQQHQPGYIFHFAANSSTRHETLWENYGSINTGTINILESVKNYSPASKVFISGSGLQFKNEGRPIRETDPFEARDVYSMCRIQSVYAARYFRTLGVNVYIGYFFNHDSPLRSERHMTQKIAAAASRIAKGSDEKIEIGDIHAKKEWGFAGDIVKAVWTLMQQEEIIETVIGTGKGFSIEDWLTKCFEIINVDWKKHVTSSKAYIPGYEQLVSDPSTIFSLGWKPEVSFSQLAEMMVKK